ncbi:MAG TPA: glycosyltransferase family 4 protein [Roseiflexaceae bacterium]|nr:glycosyltransferase family 4 protein [Roseiflexaceae bacterium]
MDTLTIVVPWFGPDTAGGAETQARQLARAIRAQGAPVEVWASDGRDSFAPPEPHYRAGPDEVDGVAVRRFPITPPAYAPRVPPPVARRLAQLPTLPAFSHYEQLQLGWLASSDALLEAVASEAQGRQFLFVPYPFPTTFWGALLAGERACLLPCLHDEPYARHETFRWMFRRARCVLANSPAERDLALRLYGLPPERVVVAGEGIDLTPRGDGARFRQRYGIAGPLLMYAGRDAPGKNLPLLLAYLREYWARRGGPIRLVRTGRDRLDVTPALREVVLDLGDVPPQERHDAYAAADVFVQPSTYESFSIVLMEAWLQGTPALVNARCDVTRRFAEDSEAGLAFDGFGEFAAALDLLLADPPLRRELGARGRAYVLEHCRWEDVARRTIAAVLGELPHAGQSPTTFAEGPA